MYDDWNLGNTNIPGSEPEPGEVPESEPAEEKANQNDTGFVMYEQSKAEAPQPQEFETKSEPEQSRVAESFEDRNEQEQSRASESFEHEAGQSHTYDSYQITQPVPTAEPMRDKSSGGLGKKFAICAAFALVFGLIAGCTFQAVNFIGSRFDSLKKEDTVKIEQTESVIQPSEVNESGEDASPVLTKSSVVNVAKSAMPSVVAITNIGVQEIYNYFGFGSQEMPSESSGSGIIVGQNDNELLIATNNHVISGANTLTVLFAGQETGITGQVTDDMADISEADIGSAVEAQVKGADVANDLAVIAVKIDSIPEDVRSQIKVCQLGDSDALEVGEQVVAIGNALGYGQSVTSGYVSALNRQVTVENVSSTLIQTDAAINPGNSGGALLNMYGELIGINAVKFASNEIEGMGYAIPIATAEPILNELMNRETRYKVEEDQAAYIGIACKDMTAEFANMYDMPTGVLVSSVTAGGPAESAGIQKRDVITKLDGQVLNTANELIERLTYYSAEEKVEVEVYRADGTGEYVPQTISVTLGNRKDMPAVEEIPSEGR